MTAKSTASPRGVTLARGGGVHRTTPTEPHRGPAPVTTVSPPPTSPTRGSWWTHACAPDQREQFMAAAHQRAADMQSDVVWRTPAGHIHEG